MEQSFPPRNSLMCSIMHYYRLEGLSGISVCPSGYREGKEKIFELNLKDAGTLITNDKTIADLVDRTDGFAGVDLKHCG